MDRSLKFLITAAAAVAIPLPAAAQAWPAAVVAAAPQLTAQKRLPLAINSGAYLHRAGAAPAIQAKATRPPLKLATRHELGDVPTIEVPAKDEWSDDEGFRVSPTKIAFKRRF